MIKGVSFDFWESLFGFVRQDVLEQIRYERTRSFADLLGKPEGVVSDAFYTAVSELHRWREATGFEFCVDDLLRKFLEKLGAPEEYLPQCHRIFVDVIVKHFPGPNPGAVEAVKLLKEKGFKLAVLSNTIHGEVERSLLKSYGLDRYFDVIGLSCELGVRKPRRDIFSWVVNRLGLRPADVLHIGDDVRADVVGALGAGLWAGQYLKDSSEPFPLAHVHVRSWLELPERLEELGGR